MGCCGRNKNKVKSKSAIIKTNKVEQKTKIPINETNHSILQNQLLKNESIQTPIVESATQVTSSSKSRTKSPLISSPDYDHEDFINKISSTDNISPIKTLNDLQRFVQENQKSISIILFYGRYCPYSQRTMPDLRQWARANKDRIFLYEADVEQASKLAEYYHIRTIPTIMAFEENNLLAPIWQRTANNVLPSSSIDEDESIDPSNQKTNLNEIKQDQDFITRDKIPTNSVHTLHSKSSEQSPYIWNRSVQSLDNDSQKSSKEIIPEYKGRMISQSTISNNDQLKKKRTWSEYFDDHKSTIEYQQHIHLPNSNEIFYEKQYDFNRSLSSDRFSTLTYQHVKDTNHFSINQQGEICVLYLGPNRNRGFEDNLPDQKTTSSKFSLLTLKSHILSE